MTPLANSSTSTQHDLYDLRIHSDSSNNRTLAFYPVTMRSPNTSAMSTSSENDPPQISSPSTTGTGWTGVTPYSFDQYFRRLPTEIRINVWSTMPAVEPRVIELQPNASFNLIITRTKTPGFLQACSEARHEGLKVYELLGSGPIHPYVYSNGKWRKSSEQCRTARILINFEIDTVFLKAEFFTHRNAIAMLAKGLQIKFEQVRRLGIHFWGLSTAYSYDSLMEPPLNNHILQCSALQKLYLICDERPRARLFSRHMAGQQPNALLLRKKHRIKDVVIAGQHCVEYTADSGWHPENVEAMLEDICELGKHQSGKYHGSDENFALEYPEADEQIDIDSDYHQFDFRSTIYYNTNSREYDYEDYIIEADDHEPEERARDVPYMEEEEDCDELGEVEFRGFRGIIARIEQARIEVKNAKDSIEKTQQELDSMEAAETMAPATRTTYVAAYDEKSNENYEQKEMLVDARAVIKALKMSLHRSLAQAWLDLTRFTNIEHSQRSFEQILRTKSFFDRYIHQGLQYRQNRSSRSLWPMPKPKVAHRESTNHSLLRGPNIREFRHNQFLSSGLFKERKREAINGFAKRQIMARRSLARRVTPKAKFLGTDDKVDVWTSGTPSCKSAIQKSGSRPCKLKGPIVTRKPRCARVGNAEGGIPDDKRAAKGYMREGLKKGLVFRAAQKGGYFELDRVEY